MSLKTPACLASVLLVGCGILFFGSVLSIHFLALAVGIYLLGAGALLLLPIHLPRRTGPLLILCTLGWAWAGLQTLPLPPVLTPFASVLLHPLWVSAQNQLGQTTPAISLTPEAGQTYWLFGTAAMVLFLLAAHLAGQGKARLLHAATAMTLTLFSIYGLAIYLTGNHYVLWLPKTSYFTGLTSTLINKNTYATIAGISVLICLYLGFKNLPNIPSARSATPKQRIHIMYHTCIKQGWPWLFMAFLNWMALIFTQSRAGMASTLIALLVWWVFVAVKTRGGRIFWLGFGSIAVILLLCMLSLTGKNLANSLEKLPMATEYRQSINQTTIAIWQNNPVFGSGLASYNSTYRMFSPLKPTYSVRMEQAHNSWLQSLAELGTPASIALFAALGWLVWQLFRTARHSRTRYMAPITGLAILVLAGTHAWADFSANIPAVILLLALIIGTIWGQKDKPDSIRLPLNLPTRIAVAVVLLLLAGVTAWQYPATLAEHEAQVLLASNPTLEDLKLIRPKLATNVASHPTATSIAQLARVDFLLGAPRHNTLLEFSALNFTNRSLALAPADPYLWYQRGMLQNDLGHPELAAPSIVLSVLTGPSEGLLAYPRLKSIYKFWNLFTEQDQRFLTPHIQSIYRDQPTNARKALGYDDPAAKAWIDARIGSSTL